MNGVTYSVGYRLIRKVEELGRFKAPWFWFATGLKRQEAITAELEMTLDFGDLAEFSVLEVRE